MTKFHEDRTKIVDFLLLVTFLAIPKFARTPSSCRILEHSRRLVKSFRLNRSKMARARTSAGVLYNLFENVMHELGVEVRHSVENCHLVYDFGRLKLMPSKNPKSKF